MLVNGYLRTASNAVIEAFARCLQHNVNAYKVFLREAGWVLAILLASATSVSAYDFTITARTEGQGYQLRSYGQSGMQFLNRRRITQYLGLRIFNLLDSGEASFSPRNAKRPPALLTFGLLMRFDTDFGAFKEPYHEIPELQNNQFDLLLGTLEGKNLLGWIDITLGRQFDAELLDFFAYDGLHVRINSPWHVFVESMFGTQLSQGRPLTSAVLAIDAPPGEPASEALAPTFGVALGMDDTPWNLNFRAAYRGTASLAALESDPEGDSQWGVDEEVLFFTASYKVPLINTLPLLGLRYNLLTAQIDDLQATVSQRLGKDHHFQFEYLRSRPHFDGDSIFNIFSTEPYSEWSGMYGMSVFEPLELNFRFGYRQFESGNLENEEMSDELRQDAYSAGVGGLFRAERFLVAMECYYLGGIGEDSTLGGDLTGYWRLKNWLNLDGRLSLVRYEDASPNIASVTNFGVQTGATLTFVKGVDLRLMLEDNISRLYQSAIRFLGVLNLEFAP